MLRADDAVRFTRSEVEACRRIGLDFTWVKRRSDLEQEVGRWAHTLADERFDLLLRIAAAMAKAKGVQLPPRL